MTDREGAAGALAKPIALFVAILFALWLGIKAAEPPRALPADAPAAAFSAARALADVHVVAQRPHPTASADNARVRAYLAQRLAGLGLTVEQRPYLIDAEGLKTLNRWTGTFYGGGEMTDVVGLLPGRDRTLPAVALMAHLDTVWGSPGGGDDSAGLAAILEVLRAIKARGQPARDVVVLFTDGEEIGLSGARAFWPSDGVANHVGVVINLEARGSGGRANMFETGDGNGAMMRLFAQSVAHPVASSMAVLAYRMMPEATDFTAAKARGLPGFNFAMIGRPQYYHSPRATADRLDPRSLQDMGDQVLDLTSALAFAKALPARSADAVFFDSAGRRLVVYAQATGWLILLGAALALALAWARAQPRAAAVGWGAALQIWMLLHAALLMSLLARIASATHPDYFDRLALLPQLEAMAALACCGALAGAALLGAAPGRLARVVPTLALAVLARACGVPLMTVLEYLVPAGLIGWTMPRPGLAAWGEWLGAIGLLLLVAVIAQIKAPMAAWLFAWPALIAGLAALFVAASDRGWRWPWSWAIAAAGAALVGAFLLPVAHLAFLGLGPAMPGAAVVALVPIAPAFWPLVCSARPGRAGLALVALLLVAALAMAVHIRHDPVAQTIPAYASDK